MSLGLHKPTDDVADLNNLCEGINSKTHFCYSKFDDL